MPRRCSSTIVTMTTGMSASAGSPFNAARTVHPSTSGIMMSRVTAAGRSSRSFFIPSTPLAAVSTAKPSPVRYVAISSRAVASSSITRILPRRSWLAAGLVAAGPVAARLVSTTGNGSPASVGRRTVKVEPSPGVLVTVISAHQPAQPAADRQPEPRPAKLPCRRRVGLGEFLKQPAELFLGHADAGVGDSKIDPMLTGPFGARNTQPHRAALGEFAGIAQQVQQD